MALRIYEFLINPEDQELGMTAISLVDRPAMESEFIAFNKNEKPTIFKFKDDKKYIIAGLALIPNKLVYRVDENTQEEYMGFFSAETIEAIMNKFMKQSTEGLLSKVNLQHSDDQVQAHLIESFILRTPEMVAAVQAMGIPDAIEGAWFVSYKFDNLDDYNTAVEGGFTGFSIEIMLNKELKLNKLNKNNNDVMTKVKNFIDKFKNILEEFESTQKFEDIKTADDAMTIRIDDSLAVGTPVLEVQVDADGNETTANLKEGSYILKDGRTVVVDAQGSLVEIKEKGVLPEATNPEGLAKYPWDKCISDQTPKYGEEGAKRICGSIKAKGVSMEEVQAVIDELIAAGDEDLACKKKLLETDLATGDTTGNTETTVPAVSGETPTVEIGSKTLAELCPMDGEYEIYVSVQGGQIVSAEVEVAQMLKEALAKKDEEIQALKLQLEKPVVKPAFVEFSTPLAETKTREELRKMNNLQLTLHKLGLDK